MKLFMRILFHLFILLALAACGHSEAYENAYETGKFYGENSAQMFKKHHPDIFPKTDPNKAGLAMETFRSEIYNSPGFGVQGKALEDYKEGFCDGFNDGFNSVKRSGSSSYQSSSSDNSSPNGSSGINFWRWIVIIFVTIFLVSWLGTGKKVETSATNPSQNNEGNESISDGVNLVNLSDSTQQSNKEEVVAPWKSFLLLLIAFLGCLFLISRYNCTDHNFSTYLVYALGFILMAVAWNNNEEWRANSKGFFTSLIRVLSILGILFFIWKFVANLWTLIF